MPAAIPYWINKSILRASFFDMYCSQSKPFTRPAKRVEKLVVSKCSMLTMPLWPANKAFQDDSTVLPTGDNIPMPVTTTRRLDTIIFSGIEIEMREG
ncbi:Uncharacterised protein [Vibrio cholerae]|nr:Uncharacterised protein [Vibrio cholerae]CSC00952.1 Uncharacterised protein [Vibrio cholerae]